MNSLNFFKNQIEIKIKTVKIGIAWEQNIVIVNYQLLKNVKYYKLSNVQSSIRSCMKVNVLRETIGLWDNISTTFG